MARSVLDRLLPRGSEGLRRIALAEILGPRVGARRAPSPVERGPSPPREDLDAEGPTEPPDAEQEG